METEKSKKLKTKHFEKKDFSIDKYKKFKNIPLLLSAVIGKTKIELDDLLSYDIGDVVELDRTTDDPIDISINGKAMMKGEVVVKDNKLCVRITEIRQQYVYKNEEDDSSAHLKEEIKESTEKKEEEQTQNEKNNLKEENKETQEQENASSDENETENINEEKKDKIINEFSIEENFEKENEDEGENEENTGSGENNKE